MAEQNKSAVEDKQDNPVYDSTRKQHGGYFWGTGRRKTAVARVRIKPGTGRIEINGKVYTEYMLMNRQREDVLGPLKVTNMLGKIDVFCNVKGGGAFSQAGAVRLGLSRALVVMDNVLHARLREAGFLTRDPRMAERKKYGRRGARRGFQFSKR
ncbi:MAG: 30S ribosomal protein S9 [Planctomycetes bacterium]|nr:30S ribosomal protein S9 [Planctomycetota bacterium]